MAPRADTGGGRGGGVSGRRAVGRAGDPVEAIEHVTFSRPPGLPGVEIMAVANSRRLYRMYHETYTVCTLLDGGGGGPEWTYRRHLHAAGAGGLMLMEPGELHATKRISGTGGTFRVLMVSAATMQDVVADIGGSSSPPHFALATSDRPDIFASFARFHSSVESGAAVLEQESRLAGCLRRVLEQCAERPPRTPPSRAAAAMAKVRDSINDAFDQDIRLDDLAQVAGVSRYHLCRTFAKEFGLPPHSYHVRVRVARAKDLLARGVAPAEVAFRGGFCDQSHLGRHFRAVLGVTPRRYEEMVRARSS